MPLDALMQLESKIDTLIGTINNLKQENEHLRNEIGEKDNRITELTNEHSTASSAVEGLRADSQDRQNRLDEATQRVQALIAKLETVTA